MKSVFGILSVVAIATVMSSASFAETLKLKNLKCAGANSLLLKSSDDSSIITSILGVFTKDFEVSSRPVFVLKNKETKSPYVKISLGKVGAPATTEYDLYLDGTLKADEPKTLAGVIGQATDSDLVYPKVTSLPKGFRISTLVNCTVLAIR